MLRIGSFDNNFSNTPSVTFAASQGILEANANKRIKYRAHMTLSAATPAAMTDGDTPSASDIAT